MRHLLAFGLAILVGTTSSFAQNASEPVQKARAAEKSMPPVTRRDLVIKTIDRVLLDDRGAARGNHALGQRL